MPFKEKLKKYWHDVYYDLASESGVRFAMKCKDVTAKMDLGEMPKDFISRVRFQLHLSLCKACRYYLNGSTLLRSEIRKLVKNGVSSIDFVKLNQSLIEKFSRKQ